MTYELNRVKMTQGEYEKFCRFSRSEGRYYTEKEISNKCAYLCQKYNTPYKVSEGSWFDGQLKVAEMLSICWMDLYNKGIDIESLFKAYSIEHATL